MDDKVVLRQHFIGVKNTLTVRGLGVFVHKQMSYLYFQTDGLPQDTFYISSSDDGFNFTKEEKIISINKKKGVKENIVKCRDFNVYEFNNEFLLTYILQADKKTSLEKAWSNNFDTAWEYEGEMLNLQDFGLIVKDLVIDKNFVMYAADGTVNVYFSKNLVQWEKNKPVLDKRSELFDWSNLEIAYVLNTEKGILVLYYAKIDELYSVGVALFDKDDPGKLLWRSLEPVWVQPKEWKGKFSPIGMVELNGRIISYWQTQDDGIYAAVCALFKTSNGHTSKDVSLGLKRSSKNPILSPNEKNTWEAFNTFNPAAIYDGGKVHILYRAQGHDYVSVLGYATSKNGVSIDERFEEPIFIPSQPFENTNNINFSTLSRFYVSGGGYGGCEDPRITKIDNKYYLTYVAFDGINPPRIALTSISCDNFLNRRFLWEKPVLISPPGVVDKSAVIFPEKINGKYVIMHRIYPDILVDFVDNLNFDGSKWLEGQYKISPRSEFWDSRKIGAGAPPIKTQYGWLLIYQSVGEQDAGRYKVGAMLLDLNDPAKVLYRSQSPILEPDAAYENEGFKSGVVYPCGAVVIKDTLYVYYGSADSYVCVATANLEEFLKELRFSEVAKLTTPVFEKIF